MKWEGQGSKIGDDFVMIVIYSRTHQLTIVELLVSLQTHMTDVGCSTYLAG